MVLGSAFLLGNHEFISQRFIFIAFFFIIIGVSCAVLAIKLNKRSLYLFFAAFFMQIGFFLFLSALKIIPVSFTQAWPVLSIFSGLALFPAGWHRYTALKSNYVVSSLAFVILGSILLVFSLDMVTFSFAQFIIEWWPLIIVLAGLILTLIALGTKNNQRDIKL
jgi:hypothetical protein